MSDTVSGPSDAAVRVAATQLRNGYPHDGSDADVAVDEDALDALEAAHDPANFEDPHDVSVRLGDVVDAVRRYGRNAHSTTVADAADFIERTFGGDRWEGAA